MERRANKGTDEFKSDKAGRTGHGICKIDRRES